MLNKKNTTQEMKNKKQTTRDKTQKSQKHAKEY